MHWKLQITWTYCACGTYFSQSLRRKVHTFRADSHLSAYTGSRRTIKTCDTKVFKAKLLTQYCMYVFRKFQSLFKGKCVCDSLPSVKCLYTFVNRTERPCHLCDQLIFLVHQIGQATDPTSYTSTLQIVSVAFLQTLIFHVYYWSRWNNILVMGFFFKVREGNFSTSVFLWLYYYSRTPGHTIILVISVQWSMTDPEFPSNFVFSALSISGVIFVSICTPLH